MSDTVEESDDGQPTEPEQPEHPEQPEEPKQPEQPERQHVVTGDDDGDDDDSSRIEEPAKVMRIGAMIKRLLDEVRDAPLDDAARTRLAAIHERSLAELEDGLSPDLVAELHRITLPLTDDGTPPSDAELRVAQAQLVGWLEGLFHGIQTVLVAQQMAAQAQLTQMRRGLPPGGLPGMQPDGAGAHRSPVSPGEDGRPSPGQYL